MRVLMTTDTVGGVWTFTKELANGLLQRGCQVTLVSFGRAPSAAQSEAMDALRAGFPTAFSYIASTVPLEWMPQNSGAFDDGAALLQPLCDAFRPDVFLSNQFCFGAIATDAPTVVVGHSDVFSWAEALRKDPLQQDAWLRTYGRLVRRGLEAADAVVAPTAAALADLQRHFVFSAETAVIPNGRNLCDSGTRPARTLQAVAAGRVWDEAKDLSLLLHVDAAMPIRIAGDCGESAPSSPQLLGELTEEQLIALFRSSAVYVCPSLYEPFGLAPLEAALCGCAVLARDIPSLREVWADGALYFSGAETLVQQLQLLADDPVQLQAAQSRSQRRAGRYTAGQMAEEYLRLMERLVEQNDGARSHAA